jgi:serine/threonine-protein kinase RsbW
VGVFVRAITISIDPNIDSVCPSVSVILKKIQMMFTVDENNLFELKVILNELIVNAISHGNNFDCSKKVLVTLKGIGNKLIYISVQDEGSGFSQCADTLKIFNTDYINNECCEHGRGLIIVSHLCLRMKINYSDNKVSLLKSLS